MLYVPGSKISLSVPANGGINLVYYSISNLRMRELLSSTFTHEKLVSVLQQGETNQPLLLSSVMTPEMRELLMSIQHCRYEGPTKNLYLEGQLLGLLALQLSFLERRKKHRGKSRLSQREVGQVRKVCRYLSQHIDAPPPLDELAQMANMNRNKLNAAFRELLGMSVFQWLRSERLEMAKTHLQHSNTPLTDIAEMLGYSSSSNFSHAFKSRFGISPQQYRRQQGESDRT